MSSSIIKSKDIKKIIVFLKDGSSVMISQPKEVSIENSKWSNITLRTAEQNNNFQRGKSGADNDNVYK